ncbi:MAG: DUF1611 domain-containing protein [Myxococcota bacterium]|nr:DUF1611 domain-containing protein [Myxococcota bacterium]
MRDDRSPQAGDLVLARVDAIGHHSGLQLPSGRRKNLFRGAEIVVSYGDRYATSQFEAIVPRTLGPCHLVAGGGVAGKALSWHRRISRGPTQISPLGLVVDDAGEPINLRDFALNRSDRVPEPCPTTIAVVGTAMDSGKTSTAAHLVNGLVQAGLRVGFAKATGTGAGGDTWLLLDAGADPVLDFTDVGLVSTYRVSQAEITQVFTSLIARLCDAGVEAIVIELADGLLQPETAALAVSKPFRRCVGGILFAAHDSMGAVSGGEWLLRRDLPILGVSGLISASTLQCREASLATGLRVFTREQLADAETSVKLLGSASSWIAGQGGNDADRAAYGSGLVSDGVEGPEAGAAG